MRGKLVHEVKLLVKVRVWGWVRVMVEFGTSSAFMGWVRVRVLGYGFGVRGRKVKSRDCAPASDLVRALVGYQPTIYKYKLNTPLWGVLPSAKRPERRAARGRPGNVWQARVLLER